MLVTRVTRPHAPPSRAQLLAVVRAANASEALLPIVTASLAALDDDDDDAAEDALRATWPAEAEVAVDYRSDAAERAREALAAAQADVSRLEGEVAKLRDEQAADFGADHAFYRLKGKCFETRVNNQYT